MSRIQFWSLAGLVAVVAWFVRADSLPIVDPTSAREMRRIELALATGDSPAVDVWLADREPPTLFPRIVAAVAQRSLDQTSSDPTLRGIDEERLESLARLATRILGLLGVLAVVAATFAFFDGPRREARALAVGALFAFAPSAWPAAVDPSSLAFALAVAGLALALAAVRAREATDVILFALVAGVLFGTSLASEPGSTALVVAGASTLLWLALSSDVAEAEAATRVGMAAFSAAAVGAVLEFLSGGETASSARSQLPQGLIALGALFLALKRIGLARRPSWLYANAATRISLAAAPIVAWLVWLVVNGRAHWIGGAQPSAFAAPVAALAVVLANAGRAPTLRSVFAVALGLASAFDFAEGGARAIDAWLCALVVVGALLDRRESFANSFARGALAIFGAVIALAVLVVAPPNSRSSAAIARALGAPNSSAPGWWMREEVRQRSAQVLECLHWLREATPSPGPWNHPSARADWTIACEAEWGSSIAYHAHRAPLSIWNPGDDAERVLDARAFENARTNADAAVESWRVRGARYAWLSSDDSRFAERAASPASDRSWTIVHPPSDQLARSPIRIVDLGAKSALEPAPGGEAAHIGR